MAFAISAAAIGGTAVTFAGLSGAAAVAGALTVDGAVAGGAMSLYGGLTSASAQRSAAAANYGLSVQEANAQASVAEYQANLNYQTSMSQAGVYDQNATVYHQTARTNENEGFMQENQQLQTDIQQASSTTAKYGASGVESDTGSPKVVQAYNAGQQQLQRMDTAYNANVQAMSSDWQGSLASYQSTLSRETAQQYQYAEQMAEWTQKAQIAGAGVQQYQADVQANATEIQGISSAIQSIGQAAGSYGMLSYRAGNGISPMASTATNGAGGVINVGGGG